MYIYKRVHQGLQLKTECMICKKEVYSLDYHMKVKVYFYVHSVYINSHNLKLFCSSVSFLNLFPVFMSIYSLVFMS